MICSNKINPDRFKICRGYLCLLQSNYAFLDRRGRRSLQGEIKLPYENHALRGRFLSNDAPIAYPVLKGSHTETDNQQQKNPNRSSDFLLLVTRTGYRPPSKLGINLHQEKVYREIYLQIEGFSYRNA